MKRTIIIALALCVTMLFSMGLGPRRVGFDNDLADTGTEPMRGNQGWTNDTLMYFFCFETDTTVASGHKHTEYNYYRNIADVVVDLSDPDNDFAYAIIDSANAYAPLSTIYSNGWYGVSLKDVAATGNRWAVSGAASRLELSYIPVERWIKRGSQVVWARQKRLFSAAGIVGTSDSVSVTLMTNPNDNVWYTEVGVTAPSSGGQSPTRFANTSWRVQTAGLNIEGYPADDAGAWDPEWNDRDWFWDIGDYTDWSGRTDGSQSLWNEWDIDVTNCVQAAVNGAVNNGFALKYSDAGAGSDQLELISWEPKASLDDHPAFLVVKVVDKKYAPPFSENRDFVVAIQADDGRRKINKLLADTLAVRGGKFTSWVTSGILAAADASDSITYVYPDWLLDWRQAGIAEIGSHSVYSDPDSGLAGYWEADSLVVSEYTPGMWPTALSANATGYDQLLFDADPEFLYYMADSLGVDMDNDPYWGKSLGLPVQHHSPAAQKAFAYHGYSGVRVLSSNNAAYDSDGKREFRRVATRTPANADTAYAYIRHNRQTDPINMQLISESYSITDFTGSDTNTYYSEEAVKLLTKSAIENLRATGRRYLGFHVHDVATNGDGQYAEHGLDPDELSWMCDVFDEYTSPYVFFSEAANWRKQWAQPVPTRDSYALIDRFKFRADDRVWYQPDGVDGRFIRNVRDEGVSPPDYPLGLEGSYYTATLPLIGEVLTVSLDWAENNESDLSHYEVYRSTGTGTTPDTLINTVGAAYATNAIDAALSGATFTYGIKAVDSSGNKSILSSVVELTPTLDEEEPVYFPLEVRGSNVLSVDASAADSLTMSVELNINRAASMKLISWWKGGGSEAWHEIAPTDTTLARFPWQHMTPAEFTANQGEFIRDWTTAIPVPQWADGTASAQEDSALVLTWSLAGSGDTPDLFVLERQHNYGDWEEVHRGIAGDATTFTHWGASGDTLVGVRKGVENYRLYGIRGTYASRDTVTAYDYLDSPYYNQAVEYFVQAHAQDGSDTDESTIATGIYTTPDWDAADTTPPVVAISSVVIDTTNTANVQLTLTGTANELATAAWEWKQDSGGTWTPVSEEWIGDYTAGTPTDPVTTLRDTIMTTISTADLAGSTVYVRMKGRDDESPTPNESGLTSENTQVFTRQIPAGQWQDHIIISNSSTHPAIRTEATAVDTTSGLLEWVNGPTATYCMAIDMQSIGNTNDDIDWGANNLGDSALPPMGSHYAVDKDGGMSFTWGGNQPRSYPMFYFGASTSLAGATVDSAYLWLKIGDTHAMGNMDSVFVYSCTGDDVLAEWTTASKNDNASYIKSDVDGAAAWTTTLTDSDDGVTPTWTRSMFGVQLATTPSALGAASNTWVKFPVTALVQDQIDNSKPLLFYMAFRSTTTSAYVNFYDNGHEDADPDERFYLEVWK